MRGHVEFTRHGYKNPRVSALLCNREPVAPNFESFSSADWLDLAIAALDQGGASVALQGTVRELVTNVLRARGKGL